MSNFSDYDRDPSQSQYPNIRATTAFTDGKDTLLGMSTRWDFVKKWLFVWKAAIRFRLYSYILFLIGLFTLFTIPILAIPAFAGAAYYYNYQKLEEHLLSSGRKVIMGH
ncbi:MAG: hypothetical protein ACE5DI_02875 [Candidatus Micrarchaeia archaeon]